MSVSKKILLILEMNETLVYIQNRKAKIHDLSIASKNIMVNDSFQNFDFTYRRGKSQLMNYLFGLAKKDIDVAIWSNLESKLLENLCQKYFSRFYRELFFILGTNRLLYTGADDPISSIPIRKDLDNIYARFPEYSDVNTLVVSSLQNPVEKHSRNNVLVPAFTPKSDKFDLDLGAFALKKYLQGVLVMMDQKRLKDVRSITNSKESSFVFNRLMNRTHTQTVFK